VNRRRFCIFCAAMGFAGRAWAHMASGLSGQMYDWDYDGRCCGGQDCVPVPDRCITETPAGIHVVLQPGDHPKAPNGLDELIPYDASWGANPPQMVIRNAPQGIDQHVCLFGTVQSDGVFRQVRCIYRGQREG
jgi:hypothetical protein